MPVKPHQAVFLLGKCRLLEESARIDRAAGRAGAGWQEEALGTRLKTFEEESREMRRHRDSIRLQRRAIWISIAVAALALVQSGLIKLPVIVDLTIR